MKDVNEEHTTNVKQKRQREARLREKERSSIMKRIVLNTENRKIKALQPLHILSNHDYNFIKKNNIQVQNMKSVSANSTHTQNITTFQITDEDIGINLKNNFNIF